MSKVIKTEYFILSLILIVGFVARLYKITNPIADWHSWRQADTASVSRTFTSLGIDFLHPRYHDISSIQSGISNPKGYRMVEFPIFNALHTILFESFGRFSFEVWGRLLTIFSSLLTAIFLFLLGKKYANSIVGLLAASFYLLLPFNIYFTRVILPDPLGVLFAVSALYFFPHKKVLAGLLFSLALLIKPYFIFYLTPFVFHFFKQENWKKNLIFVFLAIVPVILWRSWVSNYPEGIPFWTWAFNGDRIRFHPSFWRWIFGERLGILILGGWGLVLFAASFIKQKKVQFFHLFILGMLAYVVIVATASVRHDYYQILVIPAVALVMADGTYWLWRRSKFLVILAIPIMLLTAWDRIKPFYQVNHYEIIEAGAVIDKMVPKDAYVIAPYNGDTAFLYATGRWGWPAIDDSIDNLIEKGADYYVSVNLNSADTIMFEKMFATLTKTNRYIILDLGKRLDP